ncbi:RHS repeat-associated core domain-containing protein [uncultured Dysgonomonas sp.]|uniref:RHS repeat-associated core domain-containing protein n=1 Tax=uncultured Dysgonomonas sp. TaxID=206096 RepID=A0A212JNT4_9BACT|nr:RHS repeat-associated core domain-containing protein [uncultured Dysgonomonas sp.]SBW01103.1 hypothetical protein KL86DYS1_20369 [uncultured Dysgonomonas sp.]
MANSSGTVIQKNHYYPFGTAFAETTTAEQGKQPYKYSDKELDQMHGLNLYDYFARYYESAIGRFTSVDPLAEEYYSWSLYTYVMNNPLKFIDPDGKKLRLVNAPNFALMNIAKVAATSRGGEMLNYLIQHPKTINVHGLVFKINSTYDDYEVTYANNSLVSGGVGAPTPGYIAMGHEMRHGYDHLNGYFRSARLLSTAERQNTESNAVSFANYLRSVYSLSPLRNSYPSTGIPDGSSRFYSMPSGNESVSNFKFLGRKDNIDKKNQAKISVAGFSYIKTIENFDIWGRSQGIQTKTYYMTVNVDENRNVNYKIYENEDEYKKNAGL